MKLSRLAWCFVVLLGSARVGAQLQPVPAADVAVPEQVEAREVSGRVVNAATHEPVARALVNLNGQRAAFTDREGRFRFADVKEPYSNLSAEKPGYFADHAGDRFGRQWFVSSRGAMDGVGDGPVTIELIPEAILSGSLSDGNGVGVGGVQVLLHRAAMRGGMKRWEQAGVVQTNSTGEFRFAGLEPGEYYVSSGLRVESSFAPDSLSGYGAVRFPDGRGEIALAAGERKAISLSTHLEKLYAVRATVPGAKRMDAVSLSVYTSSGEQLQLPGFRTFPPNGFRMVLPSGAYTVHARVPDGENPQRALVGSAAFSVGHAAVEGVVVNVAPEVSIPLEVEQESTAAGEEQAGAGGDGQARVEFQAGGLVLMSLDGVAPQDAGARTADGKPDGPLTFSGVAPGRYLLTFVGGSMLRLISASCGGVDLLREPLVVGEASGSCTMHVVMSEAAANLTVSVKKNGQAIDAWVYAFPVPDLTANAQPAPVQREGATMSLATGEYDLLAFEKPVEIEYRNPDVMQRYAAHMRRVTLAAGQGATVELNVAEK